MEGRGERQTFGKEHGRTVDEVRTKGVEELMMDNWVKSYVLDWPSDTDRDVAGM